MHSSHICSLCGNSYLNKWSGISLWGLPLSVVRGLFSPKNYFYCCISGNWWGWWSLVQLAWGDDWSIHLFIETEFVWIESREQISQHPEFPVETMKPKRNKVTFPGAHRKGQRSDSNFWYRDWRHAHFSNLCPLPQHSSLLVLRMKLISKNWSPWIQICVDPGTLPLPTHPPKRKCSGWEEGGVLWCFDCVYLGFWISLVSWLSWLLLYQFDCCFLISLIGSWFSLHPSYILFPWGPHISYVLINYSYLHDIQINICSQSLFPWPLKPLGHPSIFPQETVHRSSLLLILFWFYNTCRSI